MDFTGFYFDNIHSSTYNLLRVSDGDRYSKNLLPNFENKEIDLVGRDEDLYESQKYQKTEQTIKVAFDSLTEQNFRDLKKWLGGKELKEFRFDEEPYKTYWAKLASPPQFDTVCFLEDDTTSVLTSKRRIYKGEGELNFIFYNGFGSCPDNTTIMTNEGLQTKEGVNWQVLESYVPFNVVVDNVNEWGEVSGLKSSADELSEYNTFSAEKKENNFDYTCKLYNPGDFESDFYLYLDLDSDDTQEGTEIGDSQIIVYLWSADETIDKATDLQTFQFSLKGCSTSDKFLLWTKNHSLKRIVISKTINSDSTVTTSIKNEELRYDLVKSTHWLKIPQGEYQLKIQSPYNLSKVQIKYNYLYY